MRPRVSCAAGIALLALASAAWSAPTTAADSAVTSGKGATPTAPATPKAPPPVPAIARSSADKCAACHLEIGDDRLVKPAKDFPGDIHAAKGFGCVACHGGDGKADGMEAMDPGKGFIGKPDRKQLAQVCGRCHSDARFMKQYNPALRVDQVAAYATSVHGARLRELGDPKVATCASCHPAHSIKPPSDPGSSVHPLRVADTCGRCHGDAKYMAEYKIPTDQPAKYKKSVHAKAMVAKGDLSAPTCNDCHGNHGATPPGISWVGNVCGQCHTVMGELFAKSVHAKAFQQLGVPGCATCHDNHEIHPTSDAMLGVSPAAVCASCHDKNDKAGKAAEDMRASIDSLRVKVEQARTVLDRAEKAGMEVSQAQFDLNSAKGALVKARSAVHAFAAESVKKETEPGLAIATKAEAKGVRALEDLQFRRRGLAISAVISLALIAALVLKIRQIDRRDSGKPPAEQGGADGPHGRV
jgi:predicted CXXCH cytochrome family protein